MCSKLTRFAYLAAALVPTLLAMGEAAPAADEVFKATKAITLPAGQQIVSFDISYVDPVIGLYVLGDRTNKAVDVIDTGTNTVLTQLHATPPFVGVATGCATGNNNDCSGPDGVLIVRHREVWVGDGNSTVKVIDLFNQQTTHVISTAGSFRADEMCFDPRHNLLMVANNADNPPFATLISTATYTVVKKIPFDGTNGAPKSNNGAEQCQWSHATGKFYIAIPGIAGQPTGTGGVAVIDPKIMKVETTLTPGAPNAHSVAADPVMNQVYVPIPGNSKSNVCSSAGGSDARGCIAVFTTPHDDRPERLADRRDDDRK